MEKSGDRARRGCLEGCLEEAAPSAPWMPHSHPAPTSSLSLRGPRGIEAQTLTKTIPSTGLSYQVVPVAGEAVSRQRRDD